MSPVPLASVPQQTRSVVGVRRWSELHPQLDWIVQGTNPEACELPDIHAHVRARRLGIKVVFASAYLFDRFRLPANDEHCRGEDLIFLQPMARLICQLRIYLPRLD